MTGTLYGSHNKLFIENNTLSTDSNTFIDYYKLNNDIIVLYGELLNDEYINNPVLITSRNEANHFKVQSFLESNKKIKIKKVSSSLKFCILAEKNAHFYPRFTKISKWDIAAGHAILRAMGGEIKDMQNKNYSYHYKGAQTKEFMASISSEWTKYFRKLSNSIF